MGKSKRVLILGGTAEATTLAARLFETKATHPISSLAGRTANPKPPAGELRIGGFGGIEGLARYLLEAEIDLLVDATHPFSTEITENALRACKQSGTPRLRIARRPWQKSEGDHWIEVESLEEAVAQTENLGRRIFLAIGHKGLPAFAGLHGHWFLVRVVDKPATILALAQHLIITGRGPFLVEEEIALLQHYRIEAVVAKNSGGGAYSKIEAARTLGLPVVMVQQPPPPPGDTAETIEAALKWIRARA